MQRLRIRKGEFVLMKGCKVKDLGDTVYVVLRNSRLEGVTRWVYLVELLGDLKTHKFSAEALVEIHVTDNDPTHCRVVTEMFMPENTYGQAHTLKLHPYGAAPVLAVNGFVWDQKLMHIKDIVG